MADLAITASAVLASQNSKIVHGLADVGLSAGKMVYLDPATKRYGLADNNSATAEVRVPVGMALNAASAGQPVAVAKDGDITMNAVLTAGVVYYLSDTPGGICPVADLAAGEYTTIVGIAVSTTVLRMDIQTAGVAL